MKNLNIGIIGNGSVANIISVILCSANLDVELMSDCSDGICINNCEEITIRGKFNTISYLVPIIKDKKFTCKKDVIFIVCKSYETAECSKIAKQYLKETGFIIFLNNLWTMNEVFSQIPEKRCVGLFIEWSCSTDNNTNTVFQKGGNVIGVFDKKATSFLCTAQQLLNIISPARIEKNMYGFLTSRYIVNSAINVLGAISGLRLGKLLEHSSNKKVFIKLIDEGYKIAKAMDINVYQYNHQLDFDRFLEKSLSGMFYRRSILKVLKFRNGYMVSSTLRAIETGKRTEINFLTGKFLEYAKLYKIYCPYMSAAYNLEQNIENKIEQISKGNISKLLRHKI